MSDSVPLCVDLDHTLLHLDIARTSFLRLARRKPWKLIGLAAALPRGRAVVKATLGRSVPVDPVLLPYRAAVIKLVKDARQAGRHTVLATAANEAFAHAIAEHLGIFDEVIASHEGDNMKGRHKAAALTARFGLHGFDYAGDCSADIPVWRAARAAILVNYPEARFRKHLPDKPIAALVRD